jgi:hypothetical protein
MIQYKHNYNQYNSTGGLMAINKRFSLDSNEFATMPIEARVDLRQLAAIGQYLTNHYSMRFSSKSGLVSECIKILYDTLANDTEMVTPASNTEADEMLYNSGVIRGRGESVNKRHRDRLARAMTKDSLVLENSGYKPDTSQMSKEEQDDYWLQIAEEATRIAGLKVEAPDEATRAARKAEFDRIMRMPDAT